MFRGTTPTLYFKIKNIEDLSTIEDLWITIKMKEKGQDKQILNKTLKDGDVVIDTAEKIVSVELSQKETLLFTAPEIRTQMKVLFTDEKVCVSPIFTIEVESILNQKLMESSSTTETPTEEDNAPTEEVLLDDTENTESGTTED